MKVIIPVDEPSPTSPVCPSFGRAPYFALCEDGGVRFIENPGAQAQGGAGLTAAPVTVRCGENAAQVLKAAGMAIYKAAEGSALDNAAALEAGGLEELTRFHAGFVGGQP